VEAVMKIDNKTNSIPLYVIKGQGVYNEDIYVTGTHLVYNKATSQFCEVEKYGNSSKTTKQCEIFHCLITNDHKIQIGKELFWDWEDHFVKTSIYK
jgi:hypothetical protein